jgi:CP family cyanate transporter-like MFS transporter
MVNHFKLLWLTKMETATPFRSPTLRLAMNSPTSATASRTSANRARAALTWDDLMWLGAIVMIGINLRPLLTSISPLMTTIRDATASASTARRC